MADSDLQLHQYNNDRQQQQQQQQQPMSSGLMRYRSAPSSYFASLLNSSVGVGEEDCDEFLNPRPSSPETERILARLLPGDGSSSHNLRAVRQNSSANEALQSHFMVPVKGENNTFHHDRQQQEQQNSGYSSASQMIYQNQSQPPVPTHSLAMSNAGMDNSYSTQMKIGGGGSNLIRQSSSPAGLLSHVNLESGYGVMRRMGNLGGGSGTDAEAPFSSSSRLKGQIDFPTGPSSSSGIMTSISENESKRVEISGTGFPFDSWDDSAIFSDSFLKRLEDDETKTFSGMNASENQNDEGGNCCPPTFLSHHLSLPKTSVMEKLLQLQDSVPCKIRAKRGFATHPRSIAERVRRTRISERMRKLQDLVPNMDKQTNTSDMLDLAVDYIKDLQNQVKTLSDNRAKCTCSNQQRQ